MPKMHQNRPTFGGRAPPEDLAAIKGVILSLVIKDLAYEAKAKAKTFFSRPRPRPRT